MLGSIYTCIRVPLSIAFDDFNDSPIVEFFKQTFEIIFLIDMAVAINTGIYEKGRLCRNRKKIADGYIRTVFIYDVLSNIPFFMNMIITDDEVSFF